MLRELFPRFLPAALMLLAAALLAPALGCGGGDKAATSDRKYAPATEDEPAPGSDLAATGERASRATDESPGGAGGFSQDEFAPSGQPSRPQTPPAQPQGKQAAAPEPISYEVPEGGVPELRAFIDRLDQGLAQVVQQAQTQENASPERVMAEVQKILDAQQAAAEKILTLNPPEDARIEAMMTKARALQAKHQMQVPGAAEQLDQMVEQLANDPDEDLQQLAVVFRLTIPLAKLQTGQVEESEPVLTALDEFLRTTNTLEADAFGYALQAIQTFEALGRINDVIASMRSVSTAFQKSPNERVVLQAIALAAQAGQFLEFTGRLEEAKEVYDSVQQRAATLEDPEMRAQIEQTVANAQKRLGLLGQELKLEGFTNLEGEPIDWSAYRGKVVLLDFWASWCGPCIREFPNIQAVYTEYKDQGFEAIGVNLDDTLEDAQQFIDRQPLPWTIAIAADAGQRGFGHPLIQQLGIDAIPFMLLVDPSGKVAAIHTRGPRLESEVRRLLNLPEEQPGAAGQPSAPGNAPAAEPPAPQEDPGEADLDLPLEPANGVANPDNGAAAEKSDQEFFVFFADEGDSEEEPAAEPPARNPYLAGADLSTLELVEFIQDMEEKPRVIQQRPGFAEAIADAADRILADPEAKEKYQLVAALAKIKHLHQRASFGDDGADAALAAFVEKMKDDPRPQIAREVKLLQLERRALQAEQLDGEQIDNLLADLRAYLEEHRRELGEKHLRLASAAVGAINKLEDGDAREKLFEEFGSIFAASDNKELARYGRRLAKRAPGAASSLVGKPIELEGLTELGAPLDWAAYRGKVVVVDFWATWCGPCRRATPAVKAFFEAHRDRGFDVVGVSLDQDREALAQYLDENGIPWSNVVGEDAMRLAEKYGVRGIPTLVLVDREGKALDAGHSFEALQPKIEELLKSS